jgi:MATE family multidrug resistance protein
MASQASTLDPRLTASPVPVRAVLHVAWPIIVSMLSFSAMNFVHALWLAPLGTAHLSASGLGGVLLWAIQAFAQGLLGGLKVLVSQSVGEGAADRVHRLGWQGLHIAFWLGAIQMALAPVGAPLIEALGASPAALPLADAYFVSRMLGSIPFLVMSALTQYLQGRGLTRPPMVAMVLANVVNAGLDPLLIYGIGPFPALEMAGAGIAANIGFSCGAIYLWFVVRAELAPFPRRPDRHLLRRVMRLGLPMAGRFSLEIMSYLLVLGLLNQAGDAHVAAHVLVVRTIAISFLPGYAVSEAVSVLVGQAVGAARNDLIPAIRAAGKRIAVGFMLACGIGFVIAPGALSEALGAKPDVVAIAANLFLIAAAFQVFDALVMVGIGVLNGIGDTRYVFLMSLACAWLLKLPLAWLLAIDSGWGAEGAWWAITAEILAFMALIHLRMRSGIMLRRTSAPAQA